MPQPFVHDDFLLTNDAARQLYHTYAQHEPIFDFHCHLSPREIAEKATFDNLAQVWLSGDHYKWRQMRTNGIDEYYCTGKAGDREKFDAWAATVPRMLKNPLYHWTHMELKYYFDIDDLLGPDTAEAIWTRTCELLPREEYNAVALMKRMKVAAVCTTDDPVDDLQYHEAIHNDPSIEAKVLPTFRPDKAMKVEDPAGWRAWLSALEQAADQSITTYAQMRDALQKRHDYFHEHGCRVSDHGVERVYARDYTESDLETCFKKLLKAEQLTSDECACFKSAVLYDCAVMDARKGWVQQLHLAAQRDNNTRMYEALGPDTGFDAIGDWGLSRSLAAFMDRLARQGQLPKTVLYTLNPSANEVIGTLMGCFQDGSVPGKIQFGSAWWFNDHRHGIERHIAALSNLGLLSSFIGMLTDSRSFLSYPRHDFFRRILCNVLGRDMENGYVPNDIELVGSMVRDICFTNANRYFGNVVDG